MKKKIEKKTAVLFCLIALVAGFFIGQFLHIPSLDEYNLLDAMRRPGSASHRR